MKIAYFLAAALLVLGQSAQGTTPENLPSESCVASAKSIATELQAAVDAVAGRPVTIEVTGGTVAAPTAFIADNQPVIAEVTLSGTVVVMNAWCELGPLDRVVAMAHELGHVIDQANNPVGYVVQLPLTVFMPWSDRPTEQRANDYARQILSIAAPHITVTWGKRVDVQ